MGVFGGLGKLPEGVLGGVISGRLPIAGSPYIVSENVIVETGDTLAVEPGVELLLHNRSGLVVKGELTAAGTEDSMISITQFLELDQGGGIRFIQGSGELSYCLIENCWNAYNGGGIYCSGSSPFLTNCTITRNKAESRGGGIYCRNFSYPTLINCLIVRNWAYAGGGISCVDYSSLSITDCKIEGNTADWSGGGVYCHGESSLTITNSSIFENTGSYGGGIYCRDSSSIIKN